MRERPQLFGIGRPVGVQQERFERISVMRGGMVLAE
jgi:hypothetical protein